MKSTGSLLFSIISSLLLGCLCLILLDAGRALTQEFGDPIAESFELKSGTSLGAMARNLHEHGLLDEARDIRYIRLFGSLSGMADRIQAGEYTLHGDMTPMLLMQAMVRGDIREYSLTIVEGWTLGQILTAMKAHSAIGHSEPGLTSARIKSELGIADASPEGWFFPDTYSFPRGTKDLDILRRAYRAMRAILREEWTQRDKTKDLPYISPYQALIMASIIEKETAVGSERQQIAGVFVRRLLKGMRLQTDPTVIYGMGENFDGNIRRADLLRPTPYNTYTQHGLPPTPIAMPGRASIHAALHPADGDSLYFVAKGDGSHEFSATLKAHNAAVRKYQLRKK